MTASADTTRRLARIKTYPSWTGYSDAVLTLYLEDALAVFLDLSHRSADPGSAVDSLIIDIAKYIGGHEGAEGVKKAKDGEMEREWSTETGLPPELLTRIKAYRLVVGLS